MKNIISGLIIFIGIIFSQCSLGNEIKWGQLSPEILKKAQKENKIVLLNLEANWCHWCHVMEDSTYSNPEVVAYLNKHFITVKADQDANPELSIRYKEFGWPATIFLNAKGEDIVKRAGYINPRSFLKLLKAIVADPSLEEPIIEPEIKQVTSVEIESLIKKLKRNYVNSLDFEVGGFDQAQKYVEYETFEYALFNSNDEQIKSWLKTSVNSAKGLSDPAWGGIYQYSTHYDWNHLHFEKLLSIQARYLKIFSYNYLYNKDEESLMYAKNIVRYIDRFLLNENGLYSNAQDADLNKGEHAEDYFALSDDNRMKLGIPKVDKSTFTNNNADIARSFIIYSNTIGNSNYVKKSEQIYAVLKSRKSEIGLYFHDNSKREVFSLKDQLAVLELLIELIKNDPNNLNYQNDLNDLLKVVALNFQSENGALNSFVGDNGLKASPIITENIQAARIFNWSYNFGNNLENQKVSREIFNYLIQPDISSNYYSIPGILMLEEELNTEANQFVYLKHNSATNFSQTAKAMANYNTVFREYTKSTLPQDKIDLFASFNENVLFVCTSSYCSSPIFDKEGVKSFFSK